MINLQYLIRKCVSVRSPSIFVTFVRSKSALQACDDHVLLFTLYSELIMQSQACSRCLQSPDIACCHATLSSLWRNFSKAEVKKEWVAVVFHTEKFLVRCKFIFVAALNNSSAFRYVRTSQEKECRQLASSSGLNFERRRRWLPDKYWKNWRYMKPTS